MKKGFVFIIVSWLYTATAWGSFLSFTEVKTTTYGDSQATQPTEVRSKVFIKGGKIARVREGLVNIRDYEHDRLINIDHNNKTWSESSITGAANGMKRVLSSMQGVKSQSTRYYRDLNRSKSVNGEICNDLQVYMITRTHVAKVSSELTINMTSCRWKKTPRAWLEHYKHLEAFAEKNKKMSPLKRKGDFKSELMPLFTLTSRAKSEMKTGGQPMGEPSFIEITNTQISTEPFDLSVFEVPEDYKRGS